MCVNIKKIRFFWRISMFIKKSAVFILMALSIAFAGCKTGLLGGGDAPAAPSEPAAPPAPVSVNGVRTSYADVVQKTSPAVVRIEADHKAKTYPNQFSFGNDDFFRQFQQPKQGLRAPL